MFKVSIAISTIFALLSVAPNGLHAQKKKKLPKAACSISYLPFVKGTQWKYKYAIPAGVKAEPTNALSSMILSIVVKSVETQEAETIILLEEKYRDVVRNTKLSCNKKGLSVPPDSFFYLGEIPGAISMTLKDLNAEGEIYPGQQGLIKDDSFYVKTKATVLRAPMDPKAKATHQNATLEMERQITIGKDQEIDVEHGLHLAKTVEVALSGRISLSLSDKEVPLPDKKATLWFKTNVGLVRAYNRLDQGWELFEMTNAAGENI